MPGDDPLLPLVYDELRALAARALRRERPGHTLQATALVHEAWLRLGSDGGFRGRTHFLATAARSIRQILIQHARSRATLRRGGDRRRVTLHEDTAKGPRTEEDLVALDDALERLTRVRPVAAQVVELRFFGGLTEVEVAQGLGLSERSVRREWVMARAWLRRDLSAPAAPAPTS